MSHIIFSDERNAEDYSFFSIQQHNLIISTLPAAAQRAVQAQHNILVSISWPCEDTDPIRIFTGARRAGLGECFFWEHATDQSALVGVGCVTTIETSGSAYVLDAASSWRALLHESIHVLAPGIEAGSIAGPILFGGFAFDPLSRRSSLWDVFPDGLLRLPRLLYSSRAGQAALTLNTLIGKEDDLQQQAQFLERTLIYLTSALASIPSIQEEHNEQEVQLDIHDMRPAAEWMDMVERTAAAIRAGAYEKVVLARALRVANALGKGFDLSAVLRRLRQSYPSAYVFALQRGEHFFVGATPERLVQAQDGRIHTMALAGSAPRGASQEEDQRLGEELLSSAKNKLEHAIVVAQVREALLHSCVEVKVSEHPRLLKLKNVQHLETPIKGTLLPERSILDVMAELHPTPAVGGFPREKALAAIRDTEQLDRGWYAGPVGWIAPGGYGEFAVALRSGLLHGAEAALFAGCGIVGDSDPQSEYAESCLKFQVMLRGLGGQ